MRTMKLLDLLEMPNVQVLDHHGDIMSWSSDAFGVYIYYPDSDDPYIQLCQDPIVTIKQEDNKLTFSLIDNDDAESWFTLYLYKPLTFEHLLQISLGIPASDL